MRNLYLMITCLTSVMFANGASYELVSNKERGINERGSGRDGRGVGGGYGGQVGDAFNGLGIDIDVIVNGPRDTRPTQIYSLIPGSEEVEPYNLRSIVEFIDSGNIEYVNAGEFYLGEGISFAILDGKLYINKDYWERRLLKPGYEIELIHILLIATNQSDDGMSVSAEILKKIENLRRSLKTLEDYEKNGTIWE